MIYYIRDISGLTGFKYNDNIYYYVKNLQNDIIGILDSNYQEIVKYKYDSWGNILSILDNNGNDISNNPTHIANINPYRYRSYYYDKETDLYYLNSRYYNPKWGRFLNADGIIGANEDIISNNLYSYCSNDIINNIDTNGLFLGKAVAVLFVAYCAIKTVVTVASNIYLNSTKKNLSSEMFNKSMYYAKEPMSEGMEARLINKLYESNEIKNAVTNCIKENQYKDFNNCSQEIEFTNGDLYYSIQHVTPKISGKKNGVTWSINVNISDKYDFTELRILKKGLTFGNAANDLGYYMQKTKMLEPYEWEVNFSFIYKE